MILLDYHNLILEQAIQQRLEQATSDKRDAVDITMADFDGVLLHVTAAQETRNIVTVSLQWRCAKDLLKNGGQQLLQAAYGKLLQASPETGYDVTLQFDLDALPADSATLPGKISLFKRHLLAGPFMQHFQAVGAGKPAPAPVFIQYRDNEGFFIKPGSEEVTVIFSIYFSDADDTVFAKVFLQEFADARKTMPGAPSVMFTQKDPPMELQGVKGIQANAQQGFVSFVLFKNHLAPKNIEKTINNIQTFRDYLHYHIKCSKGFLHQSMRGRVDSLLQVLNRAKTEPFVPKEKKTISGKTFKGAPGKVPAGKVGPKPAAAGLPKPAAGVGKAPAPAPGKVMGKMAPK